MTVSRMKDNTVYDGGCRPSSPGKCQETTAIRHKENTLISTNEDTIHHISSIVPSTFYQKETRGNFHEATIQPKASQGKESKRSTNMLEGREGEREKEEQI